MGDYEFESDSDSDSTGAARLKYNLVSTHTTKEAALTALHSVDNAYYKHLRTYGPARKRTSVYYCISHESCPRRARTLKLSQLTASGETSTSAFEVQEGGFHVQQETNRKRSGVDMVLKSEIDSLLKGGAGPKRCRLLLQKKYAQDADMQSKIPDEIQLKNRKQTLKNKVTNGWDITSFSVMMEWAGTRMCTTPENFFGAQGFDPDSDKKTFAQMELNLQNELLILETFDHEFKDEANQKCTSFGLIITSRRLLRNLYYSVLSQESDGLVGLTDGTYRIDFNRWTLVCFGTASSSYDRRHYRHRFVPWMYMFVRTEHELAYKTMFRTAVDFAYLFFGVTLNIKYGSQDHASYIASAFASVWPGIKILNCYPHMSRKAFEKSNLLQDKDFYENHLAKNIRELALARSSDQFGALVDRCTKYWTSQNEGEYARWFTDQYVGERWGTWFCTAGSPGVMPTQNPIESHHKVLKKVCFPSLHAATSVVLNETLPAILYLNCDKPVLSYGHFSEGPIPSEMVERARVLTTSANHLKLVETVEGKSIIKSIVFNAWEYAVHSRNAGGVKVTRTRAARYLDSKAGQLRKGSRVPDFQLYYLSMHEVKFLPEAHTTQFHLPLAAEVKKDMITAIRSQYQCDCKGFWTSGWICSHIVATLALTDAYDLKTATAYMPARKKSGGQRKIRSCLAKDDTGFFARSRLEKEFVKKPSMPIGWNITKLMECKDRDGNVSMRNTPGQVTDWLDCTGSSGVFKWTVLFRTGEEQFFEVDQLADLINRSDRDGLNVTV